MMKLILNSIVFVCIGVCTGAFALPAFAQAPSPTPYTTTRIHKTTIKEVDSESDHDDQTSHAPAKEAVITTKFGAKGQSGTAGCKSEEHVNEVIKDLKADCKAWVNDQKADLKSRYLTSTCEESCEDCGTSLRRCSVTGTLHYLVRETHD